MYLSIVNSNPHPAEPAAHRRLIPVREPRPAPRQAPSREDGAKDSSRGAENNRARAESVAAAYARHQQGSFGTDGAQLVAAASIPRHAQQAIREYAANFQQDQRAHITQLFGIDDYA